MRTIVIVGAVVLSGAAIIGLMVNERNKEAQPSFSSQGIPQMTADTSGTANTSGNPTLNPAHGKPGHRCDLAVGAPLTGDAKTAIPSAGMPTTAIPSTATTSQVNTTTQAAPAGMTLNPAHGKPGHRCDISVGAPLNSAPNKAVATTQTQTVKSAPVSQAAPAGLKINPAHGKPGHRCDLAVGAPLTGSAGSKLTTDSIK
ncbi:hypothetical protein [Daejeonella sp.]|uniref:hypothetical protein n=1 Tax=Daejeonella sp. TaxID=2805397 RepID=UPI0025C23187|nr:hypothetical protein [Daejeonella sp.]